MQLELHFSDPYILPLLVRSRDDMSDIIALWSIMRGYILRGLFAALSELIAFHLSNEKHFTLSTERSSPYTTN